MVSSLASHSFVLNRNRTLVANFAAITGNGNPSAQEIANQIRSFGAQYQIPSIIIAATMWKESQWRQFDSSGNPLPGPTGDIGIMQLNVNSPALSFDTQRAHVDWNYNLEIGCRILKAKFETSVADTASPYDDLNDTRSEIIENWYYGIAWYNGSGSAAYNYVRDVFGYIKSPPIPLSSYFPSVVNIGNPQILPGFPTTILTKITVPNWATATPDQLLASGAYSLQLLKSNSQRIHQWDFNNNLAKDITDSIGDTTQAAPTITTSTLPNGVEGSSYSQTLKASGGKTPYAWSVSAGSLPVGLGLNSSGIISGIPKGATTANFTIKVTGANGLSSTKAFAFTVHPGVGVTTPKIAVEQPSGSNLRNGTSTVKFGSVKVKATTSKTFMIRNTGTATLKGIAISKSGPHKGNFTISSPSKTSIDPGGSTTFKVIFKPSAKGVREAAINISSNDPNDNPFTIWLQGTGTTSARNKESASFAKLAFGDFGVRRNNLLANRVATRSVTFMDGKRYLTLTVERFPGTELPVVEVSPDLLNWYSGANHTTIIRNDDEILRVRDNTPVSHANRRYIRAKIEQ
jgi:hypothetical protein